MLTILINLNNLQLLEQNEDKKTTTEMKDLENIPAPLNKPNIAIVKYHLSTSVLTCEKHVFINLCGYLFLPGSLQLPWTDVTCSYLWDRVCSTFSGAGKFCLAHGLSQLTRYVTSVVYKRYLCAVTKTPNGVRTWPSFHINYKQS